MGFWNRFNSVKKDLPNTTEVLKIPSKIKESSVNLQANKIAIRYFRNNSKRALEITGEISHETDIPLVFFNTPNIKGAVLLIDDFTYINESRNNEITLDVDENYCYGLDRNCDLIKFEGVEYYNSLKDIVSEKIIGKSKGMYYKDKRFFIPVMINKIPIPIIRLDDADRLQPVNKKYVKRLANVSQTFLRMISDVKLLQRVGSKDSSGYVYVAILFLVIGAFLGLIFSGFI